MLTRPHYSGTLVRTQHEDRTLGQIVSRLDAEVFVGRERELATFRAWLADDSSTPSILHVCGRGGVGKSALLNQFAAIAEQTSRPVVRLDGRDIRATPREFLRALGAASLETVLKRLNARRPLLLVDTFEELADLTRFFQVEFLPRLDPRMRVVIAGRYPLGLAWSRWRKLVRPIPLRGLSKLESGAYLARRRVTAPQLVDQVQVAAAGHPLALSLLADLVSQLEVVSLSALPEWHSILSSLIEQLLHEVRDPAIRRVLEAAAVVRHVDEALLAALLGQPRASAEFDRLSRLAIVQPSVRGFLLHDDIRRALAADLRWRNRALYDDLRLRALAHYRERAQLTSPAEREWLLAERLALWEDVFVQTLLFAEDEPGLVWLEPGCAADRPDVLRIWRYWLNHVLAAEMQLHYDPGSEAALVDALLDQPALRLSIARNQNGRAVGFTSALPVARETLPVLRQTAYTSALIDAYWTPAEQAAVPRRAADSTTFYLLHLAHADDQPVATRAALLRDAFGLYARGGTYFCTTPIPAYKRVFESLGFEMLPAARSWVFSPDHPDDGFVLDLTGIGVEPWIEAIVAGRNPRDLLDSARNTALDPLSGREHQIAVLIARGLTNREIGAELEIARGTVGVHVEHILAKLGLRSRVDIATWTARQVRT